MFVTQATSDDVQSIARIHRKCWKDVYKFIPKEIHDARSLKFRLKQWNRVVESPLDGERLFSLHEKTAKIVGFTYCKPNDDPDLDIVSELHATYILKEYRGGISGPLLWRSGLGYAHKLGKVPIGFWAFDDNKAAIGYRFWGWKGVVKRDRNINGVKIPETGYVHPNIDSFLERLDEFIALKLNE
ncbi:GNAT family N-acetyltransferase [Lentilitoribacter sp. Alg239-R112]|uniref:GNAT family N-acetyltransferase n=1 Tax=Lentilitoribacter sp. Alg239-R112 TaxID=2305987 RepID=UPI0013A6C9F5|nr:GNAT family N-acetyltransferase [Lentilitoribacter sp. Alg239-R112]